MRAQDAVQIVGAGLAGTLLAVMLARRGLTVRVLERRPDPRRSGSERGRSINLALAARGIRALEHAQLMDRVRPLMIEMRGRMIHDAEGTELHPYGQRTDEVIYSVGRAALNRLLIEEAGRQARVQLLFDHTCTSADPDSGLLEFRDGTGRIYTSTLAPTIATDGAGSAVRQSLQSAGLLRSREEFLDHDYKELTIPAVSGRPALGQNALHIWPRGGFMLIALPNTDATFTATLFLPRVGPVSFAALTSSDAVREFFSAEFPDVLPLVPDLVEQFAAHPTGQLGTVRVQPWRADGRILLLGDAAHAIVPFHGQGMNAAFEDCVEFDGLIDRHQNWESLFRAFEESRRPNAEAIARMAVENYTEMRDTVLDPDFVRRRSLALDLERRYPDRFIPRYSMVMFHPEIPYAEALRRGEVQEQILRELDAAGGANPALAARLIEERLPPFAPA